MVCITDAATTAMVLMRLVQVVELESGNLMMYFRTSLGWVFQSRSMDKGRTWGLFEALNLPNPDSKVHVLALPVSMLCTTPPPRLPSNSKFAINVG
jgi:predicted neuraminidase